MPTLVIVMLASDNEPNYYAYHVPDCLSVEDENVLVNSWGKVDPYLFRSVMQKIGPCYIEPVPNVFGVYEKIIVARDIRVPDNRVFT